MRCFRILKELREIYRTKVGAQTPQAHPFNWIISKCSEQVAPGMSKKQKHEAESSRIEAESFIEEERLQLRLIG